MPRRSILAPCALLGLCALAGILNIAAAAAPSYRDLWTQPQEPFRIHGNTYYVGTRGLASLLIVSDDGHILIDGTLPENAERIAAGIRSLGFRLEDVKLIVNSHAHSDHAGAIAELAKMTGATVAASSAGAAAMKRGRGGTDDPQFEYGDSFPPIAEVQEVRDRETLTVGSTKITVHYTPGHTPGSTSWAWQSCERDRCLNLVYADSLTPVSDDTFKYTRNTRYPRALQDFKDSIERIRSLSCDILIAPHPDSATLWDKIERRASGERDALVDAKSCQHYAEAIQERLEQRIARERGQ